MRPLSLVTTMVSKKWRLLVGFISFLPIFVQHIDSFPFGYSRQNLKSDIKKKLISNIIPQPPCCSDLIGTLACRRLRKNNPGVFLNRCEADPDFSLLQCCQTCGQKDAASRHANFFSDGENSKFCFDRHGHKFCEAFMLRRDIWSPTSWSCAGENAQLAFRICKKTCGYCRKDLYAEERRPIPIVTFPPVDFRHRKCKAFV